MSKSCNKTNPSRVMTIINRVWRWSNELAFKNRKAFKFSKMRKQVIPFNYGRWKKRVFEKAAFFVKKGDVMYIRVEYNERLIRIKLNRYLGLSLYKTL